MNKKKLIIGGTAAGVILVAAIFGFVFLKGHSSGSSDSGDLVYVDSVTSIMGLGSGTGQQKVMFWLMNFRWRIMCAMYCPLRCRCTLIMRR